MEYIKLSDIGLPESRDPSLMEFPDLYMDPVSTPAHTQVLVRVPVPLQTSASQLVILAKVRYFQVSYNHGPYIPELDTHLKSIKMLIGREALELCEKRLHITPKGLEILQAYIKHNHYLVVRDKVHFEEKLIDQGQLKTSKSTASAILYQTSNTTQHTDHEYRQLLE
jgi:hypothetical protein